MTPRPILGGGVKVRPGTGAAASERDWTFLTRRLIRVLFFSSVISFAEQELAQIMACSSRNILVAFMLELLWLYWMLNRCECSRQYVRWCSYL